MTKDNASLKHAEEILEADHYGLEKVQRARAGIPGSPHPDEEGHQPDPFAVVGTAWETGKNFDRPLDCEGDGTQICPHQP